MCQIKILQAIIQDQGIRPQLTDGKGSTLDPIFINHHRNTGKIFCQHPWLVSGILHLKERLATITDHLGHLLGGDNLTVPPLPLLRVVEFFTFIATAQDRRLAASVTQRAGKQLHHWGLASSTHRKIANTDHLGTQILLRLRPTAIPSQTFCHTQTIDPGQAPEQYPHQRGTETAGPAEDYLRAPLL